MTHLLIKGMEMPKHGDKLLCIDIWPSGKVSISSDPMCKTVGIAVEIPTPHGRLIDESWLKNAMITTLEALKKNPKMDRQEMHLIAAFDTLRAMLEDAPTVIEAEK